MMNVELTHDQQIAEQMITEWFFNTADQIFVLSGYAGTGKTFLISRLVKDVLKLKAGEEAVFVTPTGKAASVLIQNGSPAGTVHGLIYIRNEEDFDVDENGEIIKDQRLSFVKKEKIGEKIRLIIIDEASMIGNEVLADLLSFGIKCLFCGDNAQLPPVGDKCGIMENPHYTLKEIVRQAAENPIIRLSKMAREGEYIPYGRYGDDVVVLPRRSLSLRERKKVFLEADQIICGRNKTRNELNAEMRWYHGIPKEELLPQAGEKLICTLNDWEKPLDKEGKFHLVNGVIGVCDNITLGEDYLGTLDFKADFTNEFVNAPFDTMIFTDGRYAHFYGDRAVRFIGGVVAHENNYALLRKLKALAEEPICRFEFAYAITCHKAQGSEFDSVVVFDESWAFSEEKSRWLYTAITRAKKKLLILR